MVSGGLSIAVCRFGIDRGVDFGLRRRRWASISPSALGEVVCQPQRTVALLESSCLYFMLTFLLFYLLAIYIYVHVYCLYLLIFSGRLCVSAELMSVIALVEHVVASRASSCACLCLCAPPSFSVCLTPAVSSRWFFRCLAPSPVFSHGLRLHGSKIWRVLRTPIF